MRDCGLPISCRKEVAIFARSEEHTSELQSQSNLVCRLLLEKKKKELPLRPFYVVLSITVTPPTSAVFTVISFSVANRGRYCGPPSVAPRHETTSPITRYART